MSRSWPTGELAPFVERPGSAGLFADFDGTLSDIVSNPAAAGPHAGAVEVLTELNGILARVAVLSGRPLAFLEQFFDGAVSLVGLYGLETKIDGVRGDHPQAGAWREVVEDVAASARAHLPEGVRVEGKGLSLTLHYREHPESAAEVARFAEQQEPRSGLCARPAKMSVELHPPIEATKGTALRAVAEGLDAVCFLGDDYGDLPAFDALDELAAVGVHTCRVAARSEETAPELLDRADVIVDGPPGVVELLRGLVARATQRV